MSGEPSSRRWWLAGLLSLLVPGLGQVYNGEFAKGLSFTCTFGGILLPFPVLLAFVLSVLRVPGPYNLLIPLLAALYVHTDAIANALRQRAAYQLKPYNRVVVYVSYTVAVIALALTVRAYVCEAFWIPNVGMDDTVLPGDQFLVHKFHYGLQRGDIVTFQHWKEGRRTPLISRCLALGGDSVEVRERAIYRNSSRLLEPYVKYDAMSTTPDVYGPSGNFGPVTIPPGEFFFIGDNRNTCSNSLKLGLGSEGQVSGQLVVIFWSWDQMKHWPRFERIGKYVE